jgi:hypothetical protein
MHQAEKGDAIIKVNETKTVSGIRLDFSEYGRLRNEETIRKRVRHR